MALRLISLIPVLLVAVSTRCRCEETNNYNHNGEVGTRIGELLKPPPPPLSKFVPVPFHGGGTRAQRHNSDSGYHYQPPPPAPAPPIPSISPNDFKYPSPFSKPSQSYNYNFVPSPQPFSTPSSSLFQKVSGWLFSSQQNGDTVNNNLASYKKDCNSCNSVPWIPVLRYDLGKKLQQNLAPTYGPPSKTAYAQNFGNYRPQPFNNANKQPNLQISTGVPHSSYGIPKETLSLSSVGTPASTYGPPSPTHTLDNQSQNPPSSAFGHSSSFNPSHSQFNSFSTPFSHSSSYLPSTSLDSQGSIYNQPSSSYGIPSSTYGVPSSTYGVPSSTYGAPSPTYGLPSSVYDPSSSSFGDVVVTDSGSYSTNSALGSYNNPSSFGVPNANYGLPSSTYSAPTFRPSPLSYATPSPFDTPGPLTTVYTPVTSDYESYLPTKSELLKELEPSTELQVPQILQSTGFQNSYGQPIHSAFDINYPISATAAETNKVRTEVLPYDNTKNSNASLALANPAPFTRGRNIHTLQPVALPNLSVSPLPPIFNARPFRTLSPTKLLNQIINGNDNNQNMNTNVNIAQSVPVAEFTHSVEYPPTIIQSPIIDIDLTKRSNLTKGYRNIPNAYVIDKIKDISSQASEDHISSANNQPDSSFETTGLDVSNDLFESLPINFKHTTTIPPNHKSSFADLRGIKDADIDKYRFENNLQNIDSPLLYLKPSAPHKDHGDFIFALSTPSSHDDYELYDDLQTTPKPEQTWDDSKTDYSDDISQPTAQDASEPKVVQIIIPYTTGNNGKIKEFDYKTLNNDYTPTIDDDFQPRKVPYNTEKYYETITPTESYTSTTTENPDATEQFEINRLNTPAILNDLYDVKEPPFDIIKLQNNIDNWTELEFAQEHKTSQKKQNKGKLSKKIPDEFLTTMSPINYVTFTNNENYEYYDHEVSSSEYHSISDKKNKTFDKSLKEYNSVERNKNKLNSNKKHIPEDYEKLHIYTAASSFRSTSTTPAPWGKIETSISPLTKEKVYVVTSKPWRENRTSDWFKIFESKRIPQDNDVSASDNLPFKSPRFSVRPSFGLSSNENEPTRSPQDHSKSWPQSINELDSSTLDSRNSSIEGPRPKTTTANPEEDMIDTATVELLKDKKT